MQKKGKKKKKKSLLGSTLTTEVAGSVSASVGSTRKGRDSVTRVTAPIKVVDTRSKQWSRWSP